MLHPILNANQERLLAEERRLLGDLQIALARFEVAPAALATLGRSIRQLDELFLLVVVGEFNSGKSAFINALLGQPVLVEGVTPTTTRISLLRYGPEAGCTAQDAALDVITAPVDLLREINIVDTPGTNAVLRQHEAITEEFVPRSDMVLFVTSADRPFTESERAFLERIRAWGKKVVVVVNKIDILDGAEEVGKIQAFIAEHARSLLGFAPEIFPVSARQALRARLGQDAGLRAASRFDALEQYIVSTLDERERIRLKLKNPIGVMLRLVEETLGAIGGRLALLAEDLATTQDIERQLAVYRQDMERDFRFRLADADGVLQGFENRGIAFFDETIRLARVFDLLNKPRLQAEYERQVVADVPVAIERRANELIDWLVASNLQQWQAVTDHLATRRARHAGRIVGAVGGSFSYDRDRLLDSVGRAARDAAESYDRAAEAARIAESLQMAVAQTALLEVGAVGLGVILTTVFTTALLDVTGMVAAGAVATLGLLVIPARRNKVKQELRIKVAGLRKQLTGTLGAEFARELERSLRRIEEAVAPYTRFVRAERDRLVETQGELERIREGLARLDVECERL